VLYEASGFGSSQFVSGLALAFSDF